MPSYFGSNTNAGSVLASSARVASIGRIARTSSRHGRGWGIGGYYQGRMLPNGRLFGLGVGLLFVLGVVLRLGLAMATERRDEGTGYAAHPSVCGAHGPRAHDGAGAC